MNSGGDDDDSDSAGSTDQRPSSRPKKRFIWPEELHLDFIAAVFDMGLKKADPSRLKDLLPKKERSTDPEAMKSCLQKLRSFRYQMRSTLGGDNLDTPEELAQKGIVPNGGVGLVLGHNRNGSVSLTSGVPSDGVGMKMKSEELSEAFEVPREFASAMDRLGSQQVKRSLELMGQCVQVQRSAHEVLMQAVETQDALKSAILEKVRQMGLPVTAGVSAEHRAIVEASGLSAGVQGRAGQGTGTVGARPAVSVQVSSNGGGSGAGSAPELHSARNSSGESTGAAAEREECTSAASKGGMGMATSAGIASMLQASAQSMQLQPRGILGTANLFSFMPTAAPPASADASPPANPESGASTTAENPPPAPPPEAAALPAGGAAAQPVSVQEAGGGAGLAQQNVDWEGAVLLGGEQGAIDQKSLRMEMKTSMDMHRLMRSRQKDQLQLHPQHQQQQQQHQQQQQQRQRQQGQGQGGAGKQMTKASSGDGFLFPPSSRNSATKTSMLPPAPMTAGAAAISSSSLTSSVDRAALFKPPASRTDAAGAEGGSSSGSIRPAAGSLAVPAPGRGGAEVPIADVANTTPGSRAGQEGVVPPPMASDGEAPPLIGGDWNWDEDAFDAQLFNFLLDAPPG